MNIKSFFRLLVPYGYFVFRETLKKNSIKRICEKNKFHDAKLIEDYFNKNNVIKVNIGVGGNPICFLKGWINSDLNAANPEKDIILIDATKQLPFENNSVDYIYSEHFIEHIDLKKQEFFIGECFRVLKINGCIRTATPDLDVLLDLRQVNLAEIQKEYCEWVAADILEKPQLTNYVYIINNAVRAWGHEFIHTKESLSQLHKTAGFSEIKFKKIGESDMIEMQNIETHFKDTQLEKFCELETMILEAKKI